MPMLYCLLSLRPCLAIILPLSPSQDVSLCFLATTPSPPPHNSGAKQNQWVEIGRLCQKNVARTKNSMALSRTLPPPQVFDLYKSSTTLEIQRRDQNIICPANNNSSATFALRAKNNLIVTPTSCFHHKYFQK